MTSLDPSRWPLQCPVDEAWIMAGTATCPDCGLPTGPLEALAALAAEHLETAELVPAEDSVRYVNAATSAMPQSENLLLDAGRVLASVGAKEEARNALERAIAIAPGRRDIRDELGLVVASIDPTGWLHDRAVVPETTSRSPEIAHDLPSRVGSSARGQLMTDHALARARREAAGLGSPEYRDACKEVARIEVAIAALEESGRPSPFA